MKYETGMFVETFGGRKGKIYMLREDLFRFEFDFNSYSIESIKQVLK